jgi:Aminoglycoside-2''-adenylyltransferase
MVAAMTRWDGPGLDAWQPWTPAEAAHALADVEVPWCVVGGWAIDLFVGRTTRPHSDLEIAVLRADFARVRRALPAYRFHVVGEGEVRALPDGENPPADRHQNWALDPAAQAWRMDVMLEPGDAEVWMFRRDPAIRAARSAMVDRTADGIPFLRPQGTLLFKA